MCITCQFTLTHLSVHSHPTPAGGLRRGIMLRQPEVSRAAQAICDKKTFTKVIIRSQ